MYAPITVMNPKMSYLQVIDYKYREMVPPTVRPRDHDNNRDNDNKM